MTTPEMITISKKMDMPMSELINFLEKAERLSASELIQLSEQFLNRAVLNLKKITI